jgi:hypothetical protein
MKNSATGLYPENKNLGIIEMDILSMSGQNTTIYRYYLTLIFTTVYTRQSLNDWRPLKKKKQVLRAAGQNKLLF